MSSELKGYSTEDLQDAMDRNDESARMTLRAMCRRSLYFFNKVVICWGMNPNLMSKEVFKERQDWIQWIFTDHKRGLLEDPRAHMKTWGATVPGPPWLALQRGDERYDHPNEMQRIKKFLATRHHLKGPDSRYILISDSKNTSSRWVGGSLDQWTTNPMLRWLYPEFLWDNPNKPDYGVWSRVGYTLNSRRNPRLPDPYLRASGLESKEQGGRAEGEFIDDLVGEQSYRSEVELAKRRDYIDTIPQLLENTDPRSPRGGFILIIGNRWALDDVNSKIHDEREYYSVWRRAAYRCYTHGVGNCGRWKSIDENPCSLTQIPTWLGQYPNAQSMAGVEETLGPEVFSCQWLNDPVRVSDLDATKVGVFTLEQRTVLDEDDGEEKKEWCIIHGGEYAKNDPIPLRRLSDHIVSIDPASSTETTAARTAAAWIALDRKTSRRYVLDIVADRWAPDDSIRNIFGLCKQVNEKIGRLPKVLCEKVATQQFVGYSLRKYSELQGLPITTVIDLPVPRGIAKDDKIRRRLGNLIGQELLFIRAGLQLPRQELRHFPTGTKDCLDAISQAEDIFQQYYATVDSTRLAKRRARARTSRRNRSVSTGVPLR